MKSSVVDLILLVEPYATSLSRGGAQGSQNYYLYALEYYLAMS